MTKQYPPIQIVDKDDQPIGGGSLEEVYSNGLLHRIVYIICMDPAGKVLLQKRASGVATNPNCWDTSAAGHVDEDETYETAARRELKEELGLEGFELREISDFYLETDAGKWQLKRFCKMYKAIIPHDIQLSLEPSEVSDTRWLTVNETKRLVKEQPQTVAAGLVACLEHYENHQH